MPNALARLRAAVLPCAVFILLVLPASAFADVMKGTAKNDRLIGSSAADTIRARAGKDVLDGRGGADRLFGGAGADRITADSVDRVKAGRGADRVTVQADSLDFTIKCGPGKDRVTATAAAGLSKRAVRKRTSGCEQIKLVAAASTDKTSGTGSTPGITGLLDPPLPLPPLPLPPLPLPTPEPTPT
ncbi:MAG TPA: calcium-binding protein, partial [Solirubrobacteraceae bacterium]|nr:calcium-binding protein [Solirubrobacteraceae bacterium]